MFILILPRFFFLDTFSKFVMRPERNTIYITDVFKDAGTNMQLVAQRREKTSLGRSGQLECTIAGVQFITLSLKTFWPVSSLMFKSVLINLAAGQCPSAASEGLFPNSHQQQAHLSVTTHSS